MERFGTHANHNHLKGNDQEGNEQGKSHPDLEPEADGQKQKAHQHRGGGIGQEKGKIRLQVVAHPGNQQSGGEGVGATVVQNFGIQLFFYFGNDAFASAVVDEGGKVGQQVAARQKKYGYP